MNQTRRPPAYVLPGIIIAQFTGTSLWFAPNAVVGQLISQYNHDSGLSSWLTIGVQAGFISGTLIYAWKSWADRYSSVFVFFLSALFGSLANIGTIFLADNMQALIATRVITGFFLAGTYPVSMKVAADWYGKKTGKALGFLVGAHVLGTALPHLIGDIFATNPWEVILIITSCLACTGGLILLLFVGNGPDFKRSVRPLNFDALRLLFKNRSLKRSAFGYFGHMWELYTFWSFVPLLLMNHHSFSSSAHSNSLWSFIIIFSGSITCILGGYLSKMYSSARVAYLSLFLSLCCILLLPFAVTLPYIAFIGFLVFWGASVIPDSPQFASLITTEAPPELKGSALTLVYSIGFFLTVVSIKLITILMQFTDFYLAFYLLIPGPLFGLIFRKR